MFPRMLTLCLLTVLLSASARSETRTWRDTTGNFSIDAELVRVDGSNVVLRRTNGTELSVAIAKLSEADRRHLDSRLKKPALPPIDAKIVAFLEATRKKHDLPAMACALVSGDGMLAHGVTGVRKRGSRSKAQADDLWHLGSNTKAMTATLCAALVEQGKLSFESPAPSLLKGVKLHPQFQTTTLEHFLTHRAGLPANLELAKYLGRDGQRERNRAVQIELAKPPAAAPGTRYEYSNLGYIVAGNVVERTTRTSWQDNMKTHVFGPLGMNTAGFGGVGTPGKLDQPWSHQADGAPVPGNGPLVDNPAVMGPAGRVHCTMHDWSKYVADLLRGLNGKPALLRPASYESLVSVPTGGDYAKGWSVMKRDWGGGDVLLHNGSNTMNFATVWIAPNKDRAYLVCTNQGGDRARKACDDVVVELLKFSGLLE